MTMKAILFRYSLGGNQNPAFGPAQIRELTAIFVDKSIEVHGTLAIPRPDQLTHIPAP